MPIIPVAAAVVGSSAFVPAVAAIAGGAIASKGAKNAARTQANASDNASATQLQSQRETNELQERMFNLQRGDTTRFADQARADQEPWRNAGQQALGQLTMRLGMGGQVVPKAFARPRGPSMRFRGNSIAPAVIEEGQPGYNPAFGSLNEQYRLRDFTNEDFQKDPGYDFRMNEGREAVEGSAAARGNLLSGATLKALQRYGQDFASNEFGNAYSRFNQNQERNYNAFEQNKNNTFNRLSSLAGTGQTAVNQINTIGNNALNANNNAAQNYGSFVGNNNMNTATNVGNNIRSAGDARASGYLGQGNAWGGALSNMANYYTTNNMMNRMYPKPGQAPSPVESRSWS